MLFCPNCSAELQASPQPAPTCWNCGADFGSGSNWRPVPQPPGPFREFKQVAEEPPPEPAPAPLAMPPSATVSLSDTLAQVGRRLLIGCAVSLAPVMLVVVWELFGGGQGGGVGWLDGLWMFFNFGLAIWILLPLVAAVFALAQGHGRPPPGR